MYVQRHLYWMLLVATVVPAASSGQDLTVFDQQGNLIGMPFEPDIPITRTAVRQNGDTLVFLNYTSWSFNRTVEHYEEMYQSQDELAPGWTLNGYGFEVASSAYVFTLNYAEQNYRMAIEMDPDSGGAILSVTSYAIAAGYRPFLHTIAPFRAVDLGPIPAPN